MKFGVSGGAGFLGIHLARSLVANGHFVRSLDLEPLEDAALERDVDQVVGDIRELDACRRLVDGTDVVIHAAAALPITSRDAIFSVNVDGTQRLLDAAREAGVGRFIFVSSTAVYGVPEKHPIEESDPLIGVGPYGESKIAAEKLCLAAATDGFDVVVIRPKTFLGPERLGVFEILFDWIREGRRIPILGSGHNRYQLLAVSDLVDALLLVSQSSVANRAFNIGASTFGTVREDLQTLIEHAGTSARLFPVPPRLVVPVLRTLELARLSPLGEWHYKTAYKDSWVSIESASRDLGWAPKLSNAQALCDTYDWYLENRESFATAGVTHRVPWNQRALGWLKRLA
jgi:nucleoside-diphosphate-sugar epimerase